MTLKIDEIIISAGQRGRLQPGAHASRRSLDGFAYFCARYSIVSRTFTGSSYSSAVHRDPLIVFLGPVGRSFCSGSRIAEPMNGDVPALSEFHRGILVLANTSQSHQVLLRTERCPRIRYLQDRPEQPSNLHNDPRGKSTKTNKSQIPRAMHGTSYVLRHPLEGGSTGRVPRAWVNRTHFGKVKRRILLHPVFCRRAYQRCYLPGILKTRCGLSISARRICNGMWVGG